MDRRQSDSENEDDLYEEAMEEDSDCNYEDDDMEEDDEMYDESVQMEGTRSFYQFLVTFCL